MDVAHWLVKQEPTDYPWSQFVEEKKAAWTGVRNYQARNHLRGMRKNHPVLYYHSGDEKRVVGVAKVLREAYPDPTAKDGDWSAVDISPVTPLQHPVSLVAIRADANLKSILLVRNSRLSVIPLSKAEFTRILELASAPESGVD